MDFFTHLMIGFLISSIASGSFDNIYVLFGTLLAALPDFDVFLAPLWRSHPLTRHHGMTHMLLFIVAASALLYAGLALFAGISDFRLFLLMCLTGSSHIAGDFITNWGVSPVYPLAKKYVKLNLDIAVNPFLLSFTFASFLFLALVWTGHIPMQSMQASSMLAAIYLAYFGMRAACKYHYTRRPENRGFTALPTIHPHKWMFAKRIEDNHEIKVILKDSPAEEYVIPKGDCSQIRNCQDLVKTYWHPEVQAHLRVFSYPYYRLDCQDGHRAINWFSAEMGENLAVHVRDARPDDGRLIVDMQFKRPSLRSLFK